MNTRVFHHFSHITDFQELLELVDDNTGGEWEQKFVSDVLEKFQKYGENMFLSEKQLEILMRIRDAR